jgi:hypothetical protein
MGDVNNQASIAATDKGMSLRCYMTKGAQNPQATYQINPIKGKITIEGDYRAETAAGQKRIVLYDSNRTGAQLASIAPTGDIRVYDVDREAVIRTYIPGKWYHIKIEADIDRQIFDTYIDGKLYYKGAGFRYMSLSSGYVFDWSKGATQFRVDCYSPDDDIVEFFADNLLLYPGWGEEDLL